MTNETIIMNHAFQLMEQGIIGTSGRKIKITTAEGEQLVDEPEAIHTFQWWKKHGMSVKKGEKAVAAFPIWKHTTRKPKDGDEGEPEEYMFMKLSHFFTAAQVKPIGATA